MSRSLKLDGWHLESAIDADVDKLASWFPDKASTESWGGPNFRYPFNRETFIEDCRWHEIATFCLRNPAGDFSAFGQFYERDQRINLARLVAHPEMRGHGIGTRLIKMLMTAGADSLPLAEYSLFVYRDNRRAIKCYQSLGFEIQDSVPHKALADVCYYMTCPVARSG